MNHCSPCNTDFTDEINFCTMCGQPLSAAPTTAPAEIPPASPPSVAAPAPAATPAAVQKPWHFGVRYLSGNKLHTKIRAEGTRLYIEQYKRILLFFKAGTKKNRLEAGEILAVRQEKKVAGVCVLEIIFGLWALLLDKYQGLVLLLLGLAGLRNTYLVLTHPGGEIRIGNGARFGSDMERFVTYVGQHSPNCKKDL